MKREEIEKLLEDIIDHFIDEDCDGNIEITEDFRTFSEKIFCSCGKKEWVLFDFCDLRETNATECRQMSQYLAEMLNDLKRRRGLIDERREMRSKDEKLLVDQDKINEIESLSRSPFSFLEI